VLSWVTFGLGALVWAFKQIAFVKKLDPSCKAMTWMMLSLLGMVGQVVIYFAAFSSGSVDAAVSATAVILLLNVVIGIFGLMAVFAMRASLVRYYNTVENIGLRLSGVMTFFFSILYFQYHFSRIAQWKQTGRLG
jgi:predicted tellurium resistance membrane protein TerC